MLLFPKWTLKRIQHDAVELPSQYWLDPVASFDRQNSQDLQLDLPITPKAFRFRAFMKVANAPFSDNGANQLLFSIYLRHMKPQYETWSMHKIVAVKVTGPIETESLPNAKFKVARGSVGLMDVDIATVLKKKPTAVPKEAPKDSEKLNPWKICKEGWFVVYQSRERTEVEFRKS
ncbi:unnamed protein product [Lactuca saligna]|uniref:Uncharacterized protein n=1 Tax=Lactuca saligna TaxID=75948 RepID=A0AA35VHJ9_LACSI|nr:unnamed protein product [Lactuca saligna]